MPTFADGETVEGKNTKNKRKTFKVPKKGFYDMTEMILNFKKEVPKAPGSYLIHWKRGVYEVIDVIRDDIRHYGGMEFGGELLVTSWGGKNVNRIYMPLVNGIATLPDIEP